MIDDVRIPHNLEAERSVLGAILLDPGAFDLASAILRPESFYRRSHQQIFAAMEELRQHHIAIDLPILNNALAKRGHLEDVGGPAYVASLVDGFPRSANVEQYAAIVREKATLRQLQQLASALVHDAGMSDRTALDLLASADARLMELAGEQVGGELKPASAVMKAVFPTIEDAYKNKRQITGLQTNWRDLDELTLGLQPKTLIYLAGRTSQGKSALVLNLAADVAMQGHTVAVFSLEDSIEQIGLRLTAAAAGVSLYRMRSGFLVDRDWAPLSNAMGRLNDCSLYVDDSPKLSVPELRAKCRRLQASRSLSLVIVDYVQMMYAPGKYENRTRELGAISSGLKQLAKELGVTLVATSQLSRAPEGRDGGRPRMSDLRESGQLEQDADLIWLLYRPEQYEPTDANAGLAELIVAKQRNGPTGTIKLRFEKDHVRFHAWREAEAGADTPRQREFSV